MIRTKAVTLIFTSTHSAHTCSLLLLPIFVHHILFHTHRHNCPQSTVISCDPLHLSACFKCVCDSKFTRFTQFLIMQQFKCHLSKYFALINSSVFTVMCHCGENTLFLLLFAEPLACHLGCYSEGENWIMTCLGWGPNCKPFIRFTLNYCCKL